MKNESKRKALEELKKYMREMGGESLKDGMSVKIISDSPEGLKEGLEKAKEIVNDDSLEKLFEKRRKKK